MILRDLLDNVKFGNERRLCVAVHGGMDFLGNYECGEYWELPQGNWHSGSDSPSDPEIPEAIMNAEVVEIDASPNIRDIYSKLGNIHSCGSCDTTVITVRAPGFNDRNYWKKTGRKEPIVNLNGDYNQEWAYNISIEKWEDIDGLASSPVLRMAVYVILDNGLDTIKDLTEEDFENLDPHTNEDMVRLAYEIAKRIDNTNELLAVAQLAGTGSAFKKRL